MRVSIRKLMVVVVLCFAVAGLSGCLLFKTDMTIELTWSAMGDLDLTVGEPDGLWYTTKDDPYTNYDDTMPQNGFFSYDQQYSGSERYKRWALHDSGDYEFGVINNESYDMYCTVVVTRVVGETTYTDYSSGFWVDGGMTYYPLSSLSVRHVEGRAKTFRP